MAPAAMSLPAGVQFGAATDRNKGDIGAALQELWTPPSAPKVEVDVKRVLEFSSGTGQHVAYFASLFPDVQFQPSDQSAEGFVSIRYHARERNNVLPPLEVDLLKEPSTWSLEPAGFDACFVANMLHISDRGTTAGLFRAAGLALRKGGMLVIYGPFKQHGAFTTPSNAAFDVKLREMNAAHYGLRDIEADVAAEGAKHGFALQSVKDMPANNFLLVFVKNGEQTEAVKAAL